MSEEATPYAKADLFVGLKPEQLATLQQFVPDDFFDEGIDPLSEVLGLLPAPDDPTFAEKLEALERGQSQSLETISRHLNKNLLDNYQEVLQAMNMISLLNHQLNLSATNIRTTREVLHTAEAEICDRPQVFFNQILKKNNTKTVLDLLQKVDKIIKSSDELNAALKRRDFKTALTLTLSSSDLGGDVNQLKGVADVVASLREMYNRVQEEMDAALVEQADNFERDVYENLVEAYDQLNKLVLVPQKLQEAFVEKINKVWDGVNRFPSDFKNIKKYKTHLSNLIEGLCAVLRVHQQIVDWHRGVEGYAAIRKATEEMARFLWDLCEKHVTQLVKRAPVDTMNFENFDQIMKATAAFLQFGATVVDLPGGQLSMEVDVMTTNYFKLFHRGSLEAAREGISMDTWDTVPSASDFEKSLLTLAIPVKDNFDPSVGSGMTSITIPSAFPIDLGKTTNSCSNMLRMLHRYLTLMKAVPTLSSETFKGIAELVEFYAFAVWHLFLLKSPPETRPYEMDRKGKMSFNQNNFILLSPEGNQTLIRIARRFQDADTLLPNSSLVDDDPYRMIVQAAAAIENMKGISWYLQSIKSTVEESLPENSLGGFRRFMDDIVSALLMHFSSFLCQFFVPGLVQFGDFQEQLKAIKWNFSEAMIDAHKFTETWAVAARAFSEQLKKVRMHAPDKQDLWVGVWTYTNFVMLNAYSSSSKCTPEGRTSMKSDAQAMKHDFEEITGKAIEVQMDWLIKWIQAYFLGADEFKQFVSDNIRKYTVSQLKAIVETGFSTDISRNDKKALIAYIEGVAREL